MANKRIDQLNNLSTLADSDLLLVYDVDGVGNEKSKNMTYAQFHSQISGTVGGGVSGQTYTYMFYADSNGDLAETQYMTFDPASSLISIGEAQSKGAYTGIRVKFDDDQINLNAGTETVKSASISLNSSGDGDIYLASRNGFEQLAMISGTVAMAVDSVQVLDLGANTQKLGQSAGARLELDSSASTFSIYTDNAWIYDDVPNSGYMAFGDLNEENQFYAYIDPDNPLVGIYMHGNDVFSATRDVAAGSTELTVTAFENVEMNMYTDPKLISFKVDAFGDQFSITSSGIKLFYGAQEVNEILDSADSIDASSTDKQLATAKLVHDTITSTVSGVNGWFDDGVNFRCTVTNGLITAIGATVSGGYNVA